MARPRKHAEERRSASVRTDLTLAEKVYVQQQAVLAGLSEAAYLRRRILGYEVRVKAAAASYDAAIVSELNRLGMQLQKLGNVVNQVALYCHTDRRIPHDWELLPSEIKELNRQLEQTLERLLLGDGDNDGP